MIWLRIVFFAILIVYMLSVALYIFSIMIFGERMLNQQQQESEVDRSNSFIDDFSNIVDVNVANNQNPFRGQNVQIELQEAYNNPELVTNSQRRLLLLKQYLINKSRAFNPKDNKYDAEVEFCTICLSPLDANDSANNSNNRE